MSASLDLRQSFPQRKPGSASRSSGPHKASKQSSQNLDHVSRGVVAFAWFRCLALALPLALAIAWLHMLLHRAALRPFATIAHPHQSHCTFGVRARSGAALSISCHRCLCVGAMLLLLRTQLAARASSDCGAVPVTAVQALLSCAPMLRTPAANCRKTGVHMPHMQLALHVRSLQACDGTRQHAGLGGSSQSSALSERDIEVLKQFDLDGKFGPCAGVTRLERCARQSHLRCVHGLPRGEQTLLISYYDSERMHGVQAFPAVCNEVGWRADGSERRSSSSRHRSP